jgi:hypothetical protein
MRRSTSRPRAHFCFSCTTHLVYRRRRRSSTELSSRGNQTPGQCPSSMHSHDGNTNCSTQSWLKRQEWEIRRSIWIKPSFGDLPNVHLRKICNSIRSCSFVHLSRSQKHFAPGLQNYGLSAIALRRCKALIRNARQDIRSAFTSDFADDMISFAVHSARWESKPFDIVATSTRAVTDSKFSVMWAIAWRVHSLTLRP